MGRQSKNLIEYSKDPKITENYQVLKSLTQKICGVVKDELAKKGLELYDIKLEFGYDKADNTLLLIDEISGGNMRVYKDGTYIPPLELEKLFLS